MIYYSIYRVSCIMYLSSNNNYMSGDSRVDPSADNDYAITYACENGHVDVVKLLEWYHK